MFDKYTKIFILFPKFLPNLVRIKIIEIVIGHLKPQTCHLSASAKAAHQQFYCGICASIRKQYHVGFSLLTNHELSLILQVLSPYMKFNTVSTPCPATVFVAKQTAAQHPAVDIAARLSVLLASIKAMDWATDEPDFLKKTIANYLQNYADKITNQISDDFRQILEKYIFLTKTNSTDFEQVRHYSGLLAYHLCRQIAQKTQIDEETNEKIALLFGKIGVNISIADHLIDLEYDLRKKQYNPILYSAQKNGTSIAQETQILEQIFLKSYRQILKEIGSLKQQYPENTEAWTVLRSALQNIFSKTQKTENQALSCSQKPKWSVSKPKFILAQKNVCWGEMGSCCCECTCDVCCNNGSNWDCCGNCFGDCCTDCCDKCCDGDCCERKSSRIPVPPDVTDSLTDDPLKNMPLEQPVDTIPEPETPEPKIQEPETPKSNESPKGSEPSPKIPPEKWNK